MRKNKLGKAVLALTLATSFVIGPSLPVNTLNPTAVSEAASDNQGLQAQADALRKSVRETKIRVKACELLMENYPNLVESIRPQLEDLVRESKESQAESESLLEEVDKLLNGGY